MARRGMTGQLNMFDFFSSLEEAAPGEVEMVSLVPSFEEEPVVELVTEIVEEPEMETITEPVIEEPVVEEPEMEVQPVVQQDSTVVMSRSYEQNGTRVEIAYLNYNKVRIQKGDGEPQIISFSTTKEAVDYYVERMQELEDNE